MRMAATAGDFVKEGALQHVKTEHPPHEEEGDGRHDDVAEPLPGSLGLGLEGIHVEGLAKTLHLPRKYGYFSAPL